MVPSIIFRKHLCKICPLFTKGSKIEIISAMYLDELQFIFKRGNRGGAMRYVNWVPIYHQFRQTYGHSKRLQTMNTTNFRAQR